MTKNIHFNILLPMRFFDDNENEYELDPESESVMNYNIRRAIEAGGTRRDIMRKFGVSADYVDAMDVRHILDENEEDDWY